mmetsp:Transcript_33296/g.98206  ORF Transcript_33296/g.98206 Transcript_33296/m.98206 type:complete len:239 (+) Transcript_33296:173-889(+)
MRRLSLLISLTIGTISMPSAEAFNVFMSIKGLKTCGGRQISTSNVVAACEDDNCQPGSTVQVTGDVRVKYPGYDPYDDPVIYLTPCLYLDAPLGMGFSLKCYDEYRQKGGYLCNWYANSDEGGSCGVDGDYQLNYSFYLPSKLDSISFTSKYGLPVDLMIKVNQLQYMCALDRDQQSEFTYLVYSSVGVLAIIGAAAGLLRQRRHLRICTARPTNDEDTVDTSFVEMTEKVETETSAA